MVNTASENSHVANIFPGNDGELGLRMIGMGWRVRNRYTLKWMNGTDRKSTRLNSSHVSISYAVFCLKKKNKNRMMFTPELDTRPTPIRPLLIIHRATL